MDVYLIGAKNPETARQVRARRAVDPDFEVRGFLDNDVARHRTTFLGLPVLGGVDLVEDLVRAEPDARFVNLITGSTRARYEVSREVAVRGGRFTNLIHPSVLLDDVTVGVGIYVQDGVIIQAGATIGSNASIHMGALVAHESTVGHSAFVAHAVSISGEVSVGAGTFVGTNATVLPRTTIGPWATIGAASVVTKDVASGATVVGSPARQVKTAAVTDAEDVFD